MKTIELMKCKCCGMEFEIKKYVSTYKQKGRTATNIKRQDSTRRFCDGRCRWAYNKYPGEFGLWWQE